MTSIDKVIINGYYVPVKIQEDGEVLKLKFGFSRGLIDEIKNMDGAKWHPDPKKYWTIANTQRNWFQLEYLAGLNPYAWYERGFETLIPTRQCLRAHQLDMLNQAYTFRHTILACEMGTGKSLVAIELMEQAKRDGIADTQMYYVAPVSGIRAVDRELVKWKADVRPRMMTYEAMRKIIQTWPKGKLSPRLVIFDECSQIKTPGTQRTEAALHLANAMRDEWGRDNSYCILMSGTPAPKSPADWWSQAETACPGFLLEGNIHKFKRRLSLVENRESLAGGVYPHLVTWYDDADKCKLCGVKPEVHKIKELSFDIDHAWVPSVNEVSHLYERMKGLVMVKFKRECTDLPEKQYLVVEVKPKIETIRMANMIKNRGARAIQALTLLRELSDGFQYADVETGKCECSTCCGNGRYLSPMHTVDTQAPNIDTAESDKDWRICANCNGTGLAATYTREAQNIGSPKDDVLKEYLESHEEIGRLVVWGGFTGTIDRLVKIAQQAGWCILRVDGRGYVAQDSMGNNISSDDLLDAMDGSNPRSKDLLEEYPLVCFIGHPKAGGMGLTLTASPTALYYSNPFDGEARMQSEDRIHRLGMDKNLGATIVDIVHLQSDLLILNNLQAKKQLQKLTMSEISKAMESQS